MISSLKNDEKSTQNRRQNGSKTRVKKKSKKTEKRKIKNCPEGSQEAKKRLMRVPGGEKESPGGEREPQEAKKSPRRAPRGSKWLPKELPRGPNPPKMASKMAPKTLLAAILLFSSFFPPFLLRPGSKMRAQNDEKSEKNGVKMHVYF